MNIRNHFASPAWYDDENKEVIGLYRKQNAKGTKKRRRLHIRRIVLFSLLLVILAGLLLKIPAMTMEYIREDTFSPLQRYRTATIARSEMASGELILVNSSYAYSFDQPDQTVPIASEKTIPTRSRMRKSA